MSTNGTAARSRFTHLQVHSHYSLLRATSSIIDLVTQATADNLAALALTDTNVLYGAVTFVKACQSAQIQPILGLTVLVAMPDDDVAPIEAPGNLVLLATGPDGYRSLCRLSSLVQAGPDRERLSTHGLGWDELKAHAEGLLCLSGGRMGWLERYLRAGNGPAAGRYAARLGGLYGERAYLSVEIHRPDDQLIVQEVMGLGRRFGLPVTAVQPVHCLTPEDTPRLKLLAAIRHNCSLEALSPVALPAYGDPAVDLHWLSPPEITARFADFPEALANVTEIAGRCEPALPDGRPIWPILKLPAGQSPEEALADQAEAGLAQKYGPNTPAEVKARLQKELDAINGHGYAPLFLIVADIVRFARQQEIPVSTRGSVANSLVAYCTLITTVDPIVHDLLFERFLNPARANMPDIDLDFCSRRRDEVLDYVRRTYGADQVALVSTVSTLQPKSAVREVAKVYGLDETEINELVKRLPQRWHPDPRRQDQRTLSDILGEISDGRSREVMRAAYTLVDQPDHLSVHPGGLVITPGPLTDWVPLQWATKGFLITQFDHKGVETLGLPKLDLLGIRALTVLADTATFIRRFHDPEFRLEQIPLDDARTAEMLAQGDTIGVFQCESAGAQRTLRQLKAGNVQDLAVANAFFKPGPAMGGMAQSFIRRYRGEEAVAFLHPSLAPILGSTQGVLIFQEQILRLATEIAGLTWQQADHLRRGMSKFQADEMAAMRAQFIQGCQRPSPDGPAFTAEQAETLWEQILPFAGYGFNRGHATAYADVTYRSAYLRAHWPAEFFCARLADYGGFHHPAVYIAEAVRLGIPVRPPHVNRSNRAFTLTYETSGSTETPSKILWIGLGQVRNLRRDTIRTIIVERQRRPFNDLRDLMNRVVLQAREITHLIQCGALDGLGESRAAMLAEANQIDRAGSSRQLSFDFEATAVPPETAAERLAWEQFVLGQPVTVHPLHLLNGSLDKTVPLAQLPETRGRLVKVAGARLPGWTGGQGFFLGDGRTFIVVKSSRSGDGGRLRTPRSWQTILVHGRWRTDEWGNGWFQAEEIRPVDP